MTEYQRMPYAHDQRQWVRAADEAIPRLEAEATRLQNRSASIFRDWQSMSPSMREQYCSIFMDSMRDANREAHKTLLSLLYYHGMRRANMPLEVNE